MSEVRNPDVSTALSVPQSLIHSIRHSLRLPHPMEILLTASKHGNRNDSSQLVLLAFVEAPCRFSTAR